eukprot:3940491-Rhodomonas_salina.1
MKGVVTLGARSHMTIAVLHRAVHGQEGGGVRPGVRGPGGRGSQSPIVRAQACPGGEGSARSARRPSQGARAWPSRRGSSGGRRRQARQRCRT